MKAFRLLTIIILFLFFVEFVNANCPDVQSGCGGPGCAEDEIRVCSCLSEACVFQGWSANPIYECSYYGSCSCQKDSSCNTCSPDCGGKTCGDDGCGGSCGSCGSGVCNGNNCCSNSAPSAPTLSTPANGTQLRVGTPVTLSWTHNGVWGTSCTGQNNRFFVCSGYESTNCAYVNTWNGTATTYSWTPTTADNYVEWAVAANNGSLEAGSARSNVCVEGFNPANTAYVSAWSACGANTHKRTRTCTETCGADDCTAYFADPENCSGGTCSTSVVGGLLTQTQDCLAEIKGTIFDATDMTSCPAFDTVSGYLIGVDSTLTANNRAFDFTDQSSTPTHPWSPLTAPLTNSSGNYSIFAYAPATYTYDFSSLYDIYVVNSGPKLTCGGPGVSAVVPSNDVTCNNQPCTTVLNKSFGFNRYFKGWWQVEGASVHAENGAKSSIPSLLASEQSLILPDSNGRRGVLTYGQLTSQMFGLNTNAKASASLWQVQSNYDGTIYDYDYFALQFKKYATTTWDGTGVFSYTDNGKGYEIVKVSGDLDNFSFSPTGTQKIIFLVNGDVNISTPTITVPVGAFMAVIASGNVNFATTVTRADGWYLADNINIPCVDIDSDLVCDRTDVQFVGNGSFVGWQGINMSRDRGAVPNITEAAEKFNYRTDLYSNAPEAMKIISKRYKPFVP